MNVDRKQQATNPVPVLSLPGRRSAAEMLAATLEEVPTHFGRLLYLARCREKDGLYIHHGLQLNRDPQEVHKALLSAHERIFRDWLNLQLSQQHEDLLAYLEGLKVKQVLKAWSDSEPWDAIPAPSADGAERRLFASDFRRLLELLFMQKK